jgi:hypothetical protein
MMKVQKMKITPAIAKEMLKRNAGNRKFKPREAEHLKKEILEGRWRLNGDTICFDEFGLIDGQHRLSAIVAAGVAVETLVVEDLEDGLFPTKDVGSRRSASDTLGAVGEKYASPLASSLMLLERYHTGKVLTKIGYRNTEVLELLGKYPDARDSFPLCHATHNLVAPSVLGAAHYLFAEKDPEAAEMFVRDLISGVGLDSSDAVYILRERLMVNRFAAKKLNRIEVFALLIKAWNFRREGKACKILRWSGLGKGSEKFPEVA